MVRKAVKVKMVKFQTGLIQKSKIHGFTLMELLVVLLIVGLFSAILSIRIENLFSGGDLRLATRIIIAEINKRRGKAAYTHKEQVLGFKVGDNMLYPIESESQRAIIPDLITEEEQVALKAIYLPKGVILEDVVIVSKGKVQGGEARIRFFANGTVDRSLIHLRNEADKVYTLQINPLTGDVRVHDKYIDQTMSK
jgi:prepilin-type N-terminal cleavage/methylation domain-containing protein